MKFSYMMLLGALLGISQANADILQYSGDTTGGPTWNRPVEGVPPTALSTIGDNVPYNVRRFEVGTSGEYSFEVISASSFDPYLFLYQGGFNPAKPLDSNTVLAGNDDQYVGNSLPKITQSLNAGTAYYLVTTGYQNSHYGSFTNEISGVGSITLAPVPEPEEWAMMMVGAMLVSYQIRRKMNVR
jgi:hypothetical protein